MAIRFQVEPDFYDHPKVVGMSDTAISLWVRAGSYSAAKLTDGFVSEDVLAITLRSTVEVADELVRRGLWKRRKGGFQFHQWEERNTFTRERVEAHRKAERERKRKERGTSKKAPVDNSKTGNENTTKNVKPQHNPENVRSDKTSNPNGIRTDSAGIPDSFVSVSVSDSLNSSYLRGVTHLSTRETPKTPPPKNPQIQNQTDPPAERCPQHLDDPHPPPCGACADARRNANAWAENRKQLQQELTAAIDAARKDPRMRCRHGTDGGKYLRPDTGHLLCGQCRWQREQQPSSLAPRNAGDSREVDQKVNTPDNKTQPGRKPLTAISQQQRKAS